MFIHTFGLFMGGVERVNNNRQVYVTYIHTI